MLALRVFGLALMGALGLVTGAALAQDRGPDEPGQFDFYVLSLSWCHHFATRPATGRGDSHNAPVAAIRLWCTVFGRSTSGASHNRASYRHRDCRVRL